jgi:hypothetical protein
MTVMLPDKAGRCEVAEVQYAGLRLPKVRTVPSSPLQRRGETVS